RGDLAAADRDIEPALEPGGGIEHLAVPDQQIVFHGKALPVAPGFILRQVMSGLPTVFGCVGKRKRRMSAALQLTVGREFERRSSKSAGDEQSRQGRQAG